MNFMALLRSGTMEQHERLEQSLDLTRPEMNRQQFRQTLERFYGFWKPWEEMVERLASPELADFFRPRRRAGRLLSDLVEAGCTEAHIRELPFIKTLPDLSGDARTLGSMYVTEGSTLGGQLLSRHFMQHLGLRAEECSFFIAYGPDTGTMWRGFGAAVALREDQEFPEMLAAARETFECLHQWLRP